MHRHFTNNPSQRVRGNRSAVKIPLERHRRTYGMDEFQDLRSKARNRGLRPRLSPVPLQIDSPRTHWRQKETKKAIPTI